MQPLVTLQEDAPAAVLSYDVPQPAIYRGRMVQRLLINQTLFKTLPESIKVVPDPNTSLADIRKAMLTGFIDPSNDPRKAVFPQVGVAPNYLAYVDEGDDVGTKYRPWEGYEDKRQISTTTWYKGVIVVGAHGWDAQAGCYVGPQVGFLGKQDPYITNELASLTPEIVQKRIKAGYRLLIRKNNAGQYDCEWLYAADDLTQGIAILERYQLSTFLGNYGAGRTIQTFTLLPGEKSKISIKTYSRTSTTTKSSSSILDSYTSESAQEFSDSVSSERTDKQEKKESLKWHVEVEAESDWGFVAVQASAGYKGGTNSGRDQFAKQMNSAVSKHATKTSTKRDIQIQQSQEVKTESGEESGVERELQNCNVGRTLNFVFRQMNQEFITLLHLVDVELLYSNGIPGSTKRYALPELEKLLLDVIKDDVPSRDAVRKQILDELQVIIDYQGTPQSFIESITVPVSAADLGTDKTFTYWRPKRTLTSSYTSGGGKVIGNVRGLILGATETVLRTDGVMVEALLGQGEGLDDYSMNLQLAAANAAQGANNLKKAQVSRKQLIASVATSGDVDAAKLYALVYPNEARPPLPGGSSEK